jgi:hypothetical protein
VVPFLKEVVTRLLEMEAMAKELGFWQMAQCGVEK